MYKYGVVALGTKTFHFYFWGAEMFVFGGIPRLKFFEMWPPWPHLYLPASIPPTITLPRKSEVKRS